MMIKHKKVKKLLKDHGVFSPANCTYEDKRFSFTAPLANGSGRTSEEQLKLIKVELANQCTLSVLVTSDPEPEPESAAVPARVPEERPHPAAERIARTQAAIRKLTEDFDSNLAVVEDLTETVQSLTEGVDDLSAYIESQERGVTAMMNAMTVILTDLGVALDDSASPQGKKAAKQRFFHVLRVMQLQMHQAQQAADESDEEADEN